MASGAQPVWAGHEFRLDPARLPQKLVYATRGNDGDVHITVQQNGCVLKRKLAASGLPLNIALPVHVFDGVAVRAIYVGPDNVLVTLELMHSDPELCVPLFVGHHLEAIAKDWQIWSDLLGLPMLLVDEDGVTRTLDESARRVIKDKSHPRRHHALFAERRPRFLARRRMGTLGVRMVLDGVEIIARG
ncbi:DUF6101 family protein [Oricola cellulosilytica]|uniref:Uncharacterized protein n=1 Tax=Oricola cellulosilytica TaxID=1429082 RepID=A0A4V6N6A6_9HYPH|nr:DUF6101 family protein [Oricola cellulosilytica]TCD13429.1 hypothetical protein E0D97_13195 [Oricola cellulosilytica]